MTTPTRCPECGTFAAETVCHVCKVPRPGFCAEAFELEDDERGAPGFDIDEEEDHRLDDPRHGQAADLNRGR